MATKVHPNAKQEIDAYIEEMQPFAKAICKKLRSIILKADPSIQEDWKWGPHYSSNGMVCGYGGFQKHVKLTFFNGAGMKDPKKLFNHCVDNEFSRSIKYTDIKEIDEAAAPGEQVALAILFVFVTIDDDRFRRLRPGGFAPATPGRGPGSRRVRFGFGIGVADDERQTF